MPELGPRESQQGRIPEKENVPPRAAKRQDNERGRQADTPSDVPSKGWLDILWRTKEQLNEDNLSIVAAGVAFYAFLALVPALAVVIGMFTPALLAAATALS